MPDVNEQAVQFQSVDALLYGILHVPEQLSSDTGVLILVGGPQYRVGSHRQFVELARGLARNSLPVMRFDFAGMGDSSGGFPGFEHLDQNIRHAVDALIEYQPQIKKVVLWGLCDGASAACFYAPSDSRVVGLSLANPWVRTEQGEAAAFVKHYYLSRLCNPQFWRKLFAGKLSIFKALGGFMGNLKRSKQTSGPESSTDGEKPISTPSLPQRVFQGLMSFSGQTQLIISGNDLTAAEFMDAIKRDRKRQKLINSGNVTVLNLPESDHTFSRRIWKDQVAQQTADWIKAL